MLSSGYGMVGRHLLPHFARRYGKENIFILAPVYQQGSIGKWEGMTVLPGVKADWGEGLMQEYCGRYNIDFVLQVGDWLHLAQLPQLASQNQLLWVAWIPFDYLGLSDEAVNSTVRFAWHTVPWTQYAHEQFTKHKLANLLPPIPLGVDTDIWRQLNRKDYPQLMRSIGFEEGAYNIAFLAANQRRKYLQEQLLGIKIFQQAHPDRPVRVYMHTVPGGEVDLHQTIKGLDLQDQVKLQDEYSYFTGGLSEEKLCQIVNCADVVMNCALEGFGLSMVQAQACGVPVISLNEGPASEYVSWGALVPTIIQDMRDPFTKPIPDPVGIAAALEQIWEARGVRDAKARQHIEQHYSWGVVAEQWFKVIEGTLLPEIAKYSLKVPAKTTGSLPKRWARDTFQVSGNGAKDPVDWKITKVLGESVEGV